MHRLTHLRDDERGMTLVFVGAGLAAFLAATTLAIDVGMYMTAKSQAQNSADAAAHAGAVALVFNDYADRTATGPAVLSAVNAGLTNKVLKQTPSVTAGDVTFPLDPAGQNDRVAVTVYRTSARGNAVPTFMARIFGVTSADIIASATAEAAPADAETCVMPFTIPDKWIENSDSSGTADGPWSPSSTFDLYKQKGGGQNQGAPLGTPDSYVPPWQTGATGYNAVTDKGLQIILKNNNQNKVAPSMYNPWDLPGSVGGNDYRNNIAGCNTNIVKIQDNMIPENGNMVGPTKQGTDDLVAKDPAAYWDTGCNCVKGSAFAKSPRVTVIPLYNPLVYAEGQQSGKSGPQLQVANYLGFFIEGVDGGGNVTGRVTPISGIVSGGPTLSAFPKAIRIVN